MVCVKVYLCYVMVDTHTAQTQAELEPKVVRVSLYMAGDLDRRVEERAAKERRSKSQMISILIEQALAAPEAGKAVAP